MKSKTDLRLMAKRLRKQLDIASISDAIISNIRNMHEYQFAKNIMIYHPLSNEINLLGLLDDEDKQFYLPRVLGKELECCCYSKGDDLILSPLNILEPLCEAADKSELDLVFVPALIVDKHFHRLGYGSGFYDRFLKDLNAYKIIPVPEELIIDELPVNSMDIVCDGYVSQKKASFERG